MIFSAADMSSFFECVDIPDGGSFLGCWLWRDRMMFAGIPRYFHTLRTKSKKPGSHWTRTPNVLDARSTCHELILSSPLKSGFRCPDDPRCVNPHHMKRKKNVQAKE